MEHHRNSCSKSTGNWNKNQELLSCYNGDKLTDPVSTGNSIKNQRSCCNGDKLDCESPIDYSRTVEYKKSIVVTGWGIEPNKYDNEDTELKFSNHLNISISSSCEHSGITHIENKKSQIPNDNSKSTGLENLIKRDPITRVSNENVNDFALEQGTKRKLPPNDCSSNQEEKRVVITGWGVDPILPKISHKSEFSTQFSSSDSSTHRTSSAFHYLKVGISGSEVPTRDNLLENSYDNSKKSISDSCWSKSKIVPTGWTKNPIPEKPLHGKVSKKRHNKNVMEELRNMVKTKNSK